MSKNKIDELETGSKIKNIRDLCRGISDFQRSYQPRNNIVKSKNSDFIADSHSILVLCREHFYQLRTVRGANDVKQTKIHTADLLVPEPCAFEFQMADEG